MGRKALIRSEIHPYHVYLRCNNKEWFDLPLPLVWDYCQKSLYRANHKVPVNILGFVLMGNHYHLIIQTPDADLDRFMHVFNSYLSWLLRRKTERINRIFADRYKWNLVASQQYYYNLFKYVFQNPVRAGIVEKCEAYKFSTLHYEVKGKNFSYVNLPFKDEIDSFLKYINCPFLKNEQKELRESFNSTGNLI